MGAAGGRFNAAMALPGESITRSSADGGVRSSGSAVPADLRGAGFNRPRPPAVALALVGKALALALWLTTGWHLAAALLFFGSGFFVVYHLLAPGASGVCRVVTRFQASGREVWLTLDDGPDPDDTPQILDLLDRHGAKATFFVIGERAERHPELIREMVRRGHSVGHHTHTHPLALFWCATPRRVAAELDRAQAALARCDVRPDYFRAPVGIKNLALPGALARRGLICVGWSIRSGDCIARTPGNVVRQVVRHLAPGAIILMHEGPSVPRPVRVVALAQVLDVLTQEGYHCVVPMLGGMER